MGIILSVLFFFIAYIAYNSDQKKLTPTFVFALLWGAIMLAESLHLFGLYKSNLITYGVIAAGVVSFATGDWLFRHVTVVLGKQNVNEVNMPLFTFFMAGTILLLWKPAFSNAVLLMSGKLTFGTIRSSFDNPYTSSLIQVLYNYVALPFSIACLSIVSVMLMTPSAKNKYISFLLTLLVIIERILIDAGRGMLLYFFVMLFFSYELFGKGKGAVVVQKKRKKLIYISFLIIVAAYVTISSFRSGGLSGFTKQVYIYICGCVPLLNNNLQNVIEEKVILFGTGGMHGPLQFLFTMIENVGIAGYPDFMQQADIWYNNSLLPNYIAPSTTFNAYATAFYNVYLDGGIVTVFLEMLLYGAFARCSFNMIKTQPNNQRARTVYLFVIYGLVFSFIRFQFSLSRNFLCFIYIFVVVSRKRLTNENCSN